MIFFFTLVFKLFANVAAYDGGNHQLQAANTQPHAGETPYTTIYWTSTGPYWTSTSYSIEVQTHTNYNTHFYTWSTSDKLVFGDDTDTSSTTSTSAKPIPSSNPISSIATSPSSTSSTSFTPKKYTSSTLLTTSGSNLRHSSMTTRSSSSSSTFPTSSTQSTSPSYFISLNPSNTTAVPSKTTEKSSSELLSSSRLCPSAASLPSTSSSQVPSSPSISRSHPASESNSSEASYPSKTDSSSYFTSQAPSIPKVYLPSPSSKFYPLSSTALASSSGLNSCNKEVAQRFITVLPTTYYSGSTEIVTKEMMTLPTVYTQNDCAPTSGSGYMPTHSSVHPSTVTPLVYNKTASISYYSSYISPSCNEVGTTVVTSIFSTQSTYTSGTITDDTIVPANSSYTSTYNRFPSKSISVPARLCSGTLTITSTTVTHVPSTSYSESKPFISLIPSTVLVTIRNDICPHPSTTTSNEVLSSSFHAPQRTTPGVEVPNIDTLQMPSNSKIGSSSIKTPQVSEYSSTSLPHIPVHVGNLTTSVFPPVLSNSGFKTRTGSIYAAISSVMVMLVSQYALV